MQKLDPHTLFSIFEQGDEQVYKEHGMQDVLENPYVLMGMVVRGLQNFSIMDMMYTKRYPEEYKKVKEHIQFKYFTKLFSYLNRVEITKLEELYTIGESYNVEEVYVGLDNLRKYFETVEEYEKCGKIKKFQDLLLENLPNKLHI